MSQGNSVTVAPPSDSSGVLSEGSIQAAIKRLGPAPGTVHIAGGQYDIQSFTVVPNGVTIDFQNAVVRMRRPGLFLKTLPGTHDVRLSGKISFLGNNDPISAGLYAGIGVFGSSDVSLDLQATVSGLGVGRPFLNIDQSQRVTFGGILTSQDSRLVAVTDSSTVDISGIRAGPYVSDPRDGIVRVTTTGKHGPMGGVFLHDIEVDGGDKLATSGAVAVNPPTGPPNIHGVRIEKCKVLNTVATVDGVDVNRANDVSISNILCERVNVAVAVVGSQAKVTNVEGRHCRAQALEYGDPTYQSVDISGLEADGIIARDCGTGWGGVYSAGIGVYNTPGTTSSNIVLRNVDSADTDGRSQRFGFGMSSGVRGVRIVGGRLSGYQGRVLNLAPASELTLEGVG